MTRNPIICLCHLLFEFYGLPDLSSSFVIMTNDVLVCRTGDLKDPRRMIMFEGHPGFLFCMTRSTICPVSVLFLTSDFTRSHDLLPVDLLVTRFFESTGVEAH